MADLADVYRDTRGEICELVRSLPEDELDKEIPATPGWSIRDAVAHLTGDAVCVIEGDFPNEYFAAFGEDEVIPSLNDWTAKQVSVRADRPLEEVIVEWDGAGGALESMMRGDTPYPDGLPMFTDRILITDIGVHQQDIFGALGIERARDSTPVKLGTSGYIATMGFRLSSVGIPPLALDYGKVAIAGQGEPAATVCATRFEFFRALSGRRNRDQICAYDWTGDPEPYLHYFYPYGARADALIE